MLAFRLTGKIDGDAIPATNYCHVILDHQKSMDQSVSDPAMESEYAQLRTYLGVTTTTTTSSP